jgi:predicted AAA+ superfamily ATPase
LTGSSSFEIAQHTGEPLTGRHFTMTLLPVMQMELGENNFGRREHLEDFLLFGSYPEVLLENSKEQKIRILDELVNSYLLKDVLVLDNIKSPVTLIDILKALAFQIGNEVSFTEIGRLVGKDVKTVQRYIDILEKTFVVKRVGAYSKNLRNEISKKSKFYFYDIGIRNAIINQYNGLDLRNDVGALWENFIFMELFKKSRALGLRQELYFWRTHQGAEVDIIVEKDGLIHAYECKWKNSNSVKSGKFLEFYPGIKIDVINKSNYLDFLR